MKRKQWNLCKITLSMILTCLAATSSLAYEDNILYVGKPEILADAPWRMDSNSELIPVLIFLHDFDDPDNTYTLDNIYVYDSNNNDESVNIYDENGIDIGNDLDELPATINEYAWYRIVFLNQTELTSSQNSFNINVVLDGDGEYELGGITFEVGNVSTSFYIVSSGFSLPSLGGSWYCGDTHHHTVYSDNAVEFGAPVNASWIMGDAIGLDWVILTDHSFDLDSTEGFTDLEDKATDGDYINETARWSDLKTECNGIDSDFKCLVGEEVSARNSEDEYVHILAYNISGLTEAIKGEGGGGVWRMDFLKLANPAVSALTDFGEYDLEVERNYDDFTSAYTPNISSAIS